VLPFKFVGSATRKTAKNPKAVAKGKGRVITPRLLGGEEVIASEYDDPRRPLLDWLRDAENPYFAKALVNRVWAAYFGAGLIDPPDDMNLANPPSNGKLLDDLASRFIDHSYDLKGLHREITTSRAYQMSWRPNETNRRDERNNSRAVVRRHPPKWPTALYSPRPPTKFKRGCWPSHGTPGPSVLAAAMQTIATVRVTR
jgi:hypothetical protein